MLLVLMSLLMIAILAGGSMILAGGATWRRVNQAWRQAAGELGLRFTPGIGIFKEDPVVEGELDGAQIRVDICTESGGRVSKFTRTAVRHPGIPRALGLRRKGLLQRLRSVPAGEDLPTGDQLFDRQVQTTGEAIEAMVALDAPARRAVLEFLEVGGPHEAHVGDGEIYFDRAGLITDAGSLTAIVRRAAGLACRFAAAGQAIDERLADNLEREPVAEVRERLLDVLVACFRGSPATIRALRATLRDRHPELRLRAALASVLPDEEVRPVVWELAGNPEVPVAVRVGALEHLAARALEPAAMAVLEAALTSAPDGVRLATLAALEKSGLRPGLAVLLRLAQEAAPEVAAAALASIRACGDPAAEEPLLALLDRAEGEARDAIVDALGAVGSARSVAQLLEIEADREAHDRLRRGARQAIGAIQSRIEGAGAGQLSLAETSRLAGGLALASAAGALAFADQADRAEAEAEAAPDERRPAPAEPEAHLEA